MRSTRPTPAPPPRHTAPPRPASAAGALAWRPPASRLEGWLGATWVLGAVLGLGLAIRLAHFVALSGSPFFDSLVLDARYYDAWARDIAAGKWIGDAAFWVDPLYAYLLGIVYAVAGHDLLWARLINIACGLATALLVAQIAQRVWQSRAAAALAALLSVTFVPAYYFEGQTEKTAVTVLLITAAMALFLRGTRRALFAGGVVLGLAALARGNALLFAPFAAAALLLGWESDAAPP
ncbi:MAG: glycosyltransferase family 39 protein, partial [Deltaproteobacteria bacterium]|nr:glycosyltransferase family 39 protein [Deltaproteobacteria bacterium]